MFKVAFAGSGQVCVAFLKTLKQDPRFNLPLIITKEYKKQCADEYTAVAQYGIDNKIETIAPKKLNELNAYQLTQYDAIIVLSYGKIIPSSLLSQTRCLNIHGSLLPRWQGASPIQHAILNGDTETGMTLMEIDQNIDTGAIISQKRVPIYNTDTTSSILDRFSAEGPSWSCDSIYNYLSGTTQSQVQHQTHTAYARKLTHSDSDINWTQDAYSINRQIRAYIPWPGTHLQIGDKLFKPVETQVIDIQHNTPPGHTINDTLLIACGQYALQVLTLTPYGKKTMSCLEFLKGYKVPANTRVNNKTR